MLPASVLQLTSADRKMKFLFALVLVVLALFASTESVFAGEPVLRSRRSAQIQPEKVLNVLLKLKAAGAKHLSPNINYDKIASVISDLLNSIKTQIPSLEAGQLEQIKSKLLQAVQVNQPEEIISKLLQAVGANQPDQILSKLLQAVKTNQLAPALNAPNLVELIELLKAAIPSIKREQLSHLVPQAINAVEAIKQAIKEGR